MKSRALLFLSMNEESAMQWISPYVNTQEWTIIRAQDHLHSAQFKQFLGQELKQVVFDATQGFYLDHFAQIAGALKSGSLLILLLPRTFKSWKDQSSLRWNHADLSKICPNFNHHLQQTIKATCQQFDRDRVLHLKDLTLQSQQMLSRWIMNFLNADKSRLSSHTKSQIERKNRAIKADFELLMQRIQQKWRTSARSLILISGKRGCGKSTFSGFLSQAQSAWLTAPSKKAAHQILKINPNLPFFAPDALCEQLKALDKISFPKVLLIDEVAMIPLAMLHQLLRAPCHFVMTSTTEGYEGTGQGLLQKLLKQYPIEQFLFDRVYRFDEADPIAFFNDQLTLSKSIKPSLIALNHNAKTANFKTAAISQAQMAQNGMEIYWQLLKSAHYKTHFADLRRLFDGDDLFFYQAQNADSNAVFGFLTAIKEGSLAADLVQNIMQGKRRPKGNLLVQSLAAHAFCQEAAQWRSKRLHRIAVIECKRRLGCGAQLVQRCFSESLQDDFLSVSFSYAPEVMQFWQAQGFKWVHFGSSQETATGAYSIMMILPISAKAKALVDSLQTQLARNAVYWRRILANKAPFLDDLKQGDAIFTPADRAHLMHFAFENASYSAALPLLWRYAQELKPQNTIQWRDFPVFLQWQRCIDPFAFRFQPALLTQPRLSKKATIHALRQEIAALLSATVTPFL